MSRHGHIWRWGAAGLTSLLLGSALAVPERLPQPLQFTIHVAVDRAASFWLWVLNQPSSDLGEPVAGLGNRLPVRVGFPPYAPSEAVPACSASDKV